MNMNEINCFKDDLDSRKLDCNPFKFNHNLADHPSLKIENLSKIIAEMPSEKVMFSKNLNNLNKNFDNALNYDKKNLDLNEVIKAILISNSYIAVRNLEIHESFKNIFNSLISEVSVLLRANKTGDRPIQPTLWLFIASPNVVTPLHFDRTSNFIMQIRGSKELAVFSPKNYDIFSRIETEAYMDRTGDLTSWSEEIDHHAKKFNFKSGEAVHIPFTSGHYVKNGSEDISITLSFFFHSDETLCWSEAMIMNHRLRRVGIQTRAVGQSIVVDSLKSRFFPAMNSAVNAARKIRDKKLS